MKNEKKIELLKKQQGRKKRIASAGMNIQWPDFTGEAVAKHAPETVACEVSLDRLRQSVRHVNAARR